MRETKPVFAVTESSMYKIEQAKDGSARATKVAIGGKSKFPIGEELGGNMVGIMFNQLIGYAYGRRLPPEHVNTKHWRGNSSGLTALFLDENVARDCLYTADRGHWDERWSQQTLEALQEIGMDHPSIVISDWTGSGGAASEVRATRFRSLLHEAHFSTQTP